MRRGIWDVLQRFGDLSRRGERSAPLPLPDNLIALPSSEGVSLLAGSRVHGDYLRLTPHFVTQDHPTFCGPTTMAILLNALNVGAPDRAHRFTQHNVFNRRTDAVRPRRAIVRNGMGLSILADYLAAHDVRALIRYASESSLDAFREEVVTVIEDPDRFAVVNYLRTAIGQEGVGHVSPVAAYDGASDRFLVLDVSRRRYPPVWARATDLFDAMNTQAGKRSRGYAIVSR